MNHRKKETFLQEKIKKINSVASHHDFWELELRPEAGLDDLAEDDLAAGESSLHSSATRPGRSDQPRIIRAIEFSKQRWLEGLLGIGTGLDAWLEEVLRIQEVYPVSRFFSIPDPGSNKQKSINCYKKFPPV